MHTNGIESVWALLKCISSITTGRRSIAVATSTSSPSDSNKGSGRVGTLDFLAALCEGGAVGKRLAYASLTRG